jgi:HAD superfamily hydrolase (TIGR01484 family)
MKYVIFLDIDGTIMADGEIHPRTVNAVRAAQKKGHKVLINTGRSYSVIQPEVLEKVQPSGIVAGLGAWICLDGEVLLSRAANREQILLAMSVSDKYSIPVFLEGENCSVSYSSFPRFGEDHAVVSSADLFERFPGIRISKFTYAKPLPEEAVRELETEFSVFNHPTYAEMGFKGCSKATGMEHVRALLGIDRDHVIAMGDSANDVLMLKTAGIAVVMGNGVPELKAIANFVSIDCKEGGVGYAIEKLVLEKE